MTSVATRLHRLDVSTFHHVNREWTFALFDTLMPQLTRVGSSGLIWIVIALLLAIKRDTRVAALSSLIALALATPVFVLVKQVVARERPYYAEQHVRSLAPMLHSYSFPSGHATISFAAWSAIAWSLRSSPTGLRAWSRALLVLASAIAYSRVYVGAHYPSDVLGGAVAGIVCGIASAMLMQLTIQRSRRRSAP